MGVNLPSNVILDSAAYKLNLIMLLKPRSRFTNIGRSHFLKSSWELRGRVVLGARGKGVVKDGGEIIVASGPGRRSICSLNIHTYLYK